MLCRKFYGRGRICGLEIHISFPFAVPFAYKRGAHEFLLEVYPNSDS